MKLEIEGMNWRLKLLLNTNFYFPKKAPLFAAKSPVFFQQWQFSADFWEFAFSYSIAAATISTIELAKAILWPGARAPVSCPKRPAARFARSVSACRTAKDGRNSSRLKRFWKWFCGAEKDSSAGFRLDAKFGRGAISLVAERRAESDLK